MFNDCDGISVASNTLSTLCQIQFHKSPDQGTVLD